MPDADGAAARPASTPPGQASAASASVSRAVCATRPKVRQTIARIEVSSAPDLARLDGRLELLARDVENLLLRTELVAGEALHALDRDRQRLRLDPHIAEGLVSRPQTRRRRHAHRHVRRLRHREDMDDVEV